MGSEEDLEQEAADLVPADRVAGRPVPDRVPGPAVPEQAGRVPRTQ